MKFQALERRWVVPAAAALLGLLCGATIIKRPTLAVALALSVCVAIALIILGSRAFAWSIVLVAVIPWYPFLTDTALPPVVPQKILCAAIAGAPLVPWLWVAAAQRSFQRPSRLALLYGLMFAGLAVFIYQAVGAIKPMIQSQTFGLLFGGAAFLCARRFGRTDAWPRAAFVGVVALIAMGLVAYANVPDQRVGGFSGYPITFGALVVALLPGGLTFALGRSKILAAVLAAAAGALLILSESRSSWIAVIVLLLVLVVLLVRLQQWRALRGVGALAAVVIALVVATGSLQGIVERKLGPEVRQSESVTHRTYSYGFAAGQLRERPVFGAGAPGYSAQASDQETGIGALDNGYLSITVDTGLFGLAMVMVPILMTLALLGSWIRRAAAPPADDLALALGILGIAVVTVFYDSFYWAQLSLLLFAMGGTLSTRWQRTPRRRRRSRRRQTRSATGGVLVSDSW